MLTTNKRLDVRGASSLQVDLRLVIEHKLVVLDGLPKLRLQQYSRVTFSARNLVHCVATRSPLRLIHCRLRGFHQGSQVATVLRKHRYTDAARNVNLLPFNLEG